jgi:uncharacterized protein (TIGR03382 family)
MRKVVSIALVLVVPVAAEASLCNLEPVTLDVPSNCSLVMYKRAGGTLPAIELRRGDQVIPVEPMVVKSTYVQLDVAYSDQCGDERVSETRTEPYDLVELSLPGAQIGDTIFISGQGQLGTITEGASQCRTAPEWGPWCNDSGKIDCDEHAALAGDGGGCSSTNGGGWLAALALTSLVGWSSRRRCSSRRRA